MSVEYIRTMAAQDPSGGSSSRGLSKPAALVRG